MLVMQRALTLARLGKPVDQQRQPGTVADRDLLQIMLAAEGFQIQSAASAEEGLAMILQKPPDLILLDVMMTGMDGYQMAAKIKGTRATRHIPTSATEPGGKM